MTVKKTKKPKAISTPKNRAQYVKLVKKGEAHHNNNNFVEALRYLTTAWKFDDTDPNLLILVANSLFKIGNKAAAMDLMLHTLQTRPNDPTIISILGNAALRMDFFELSQKFHAKYIELLPNDPIGYNNYATALREDGKLDEAISFLQDILPIFSDSEILWNTLASIVAYRDGYGNAIVFYNECLKINPNNAKALNNIAPSYAALKDYENSEIAIRKAMELDPTSKGPHLFLSSLLLESGRLEEGWEEYQWRHDVDFMNLTIQNNKIPYWKGESLKGKKIFIFGEQGVGDEIIFTWLYNEIIAEAEETGLGCEERLVPLFKNSFPSTTVSKAENRINVALDIRFAIFPDIDISDYDFQCCAGDLAKIKWTKPEDIKETSEPILIPSKEKTDYWKEKLSALPHKISVGISWRSGITHAKRARNYTSLLNWQPLLKDKEINIINIQYGECEQELKEFEQQTGIKIHNFKDLNLKDDFDGTTALISNMDLCIGPGSAPIMQSSMAGVESWFILSASPWWRFGSETPKWRTNMKLLIKEDSAPWLGHLENCAIELQKWLKIKNK